MPNWVNCLLEYLPKVDYHSKCIFPLINMPAVTSQATKNLEQGADAGLPNTEFSNVAHESGSKPTEVRWETGTTIIRAV